MARSSRRAARVDGSLTIGALLDALHDDYPDLSVSKVRFLESQGLIQPLRTDGGYRVYRPADIQRLRFVLTAQQERFWPLKVIRDALDAMDRGLTPPELGEDRRPAVPEASPDPAVPGLTELARPPRLRATAQELRTASGLDEATFTALRDYGLLPAGDTFDEDALAVARAAAQLARYGVEPRHLRAYRTAADREVSLVRSVVAPLRAAIAAGTRVDPTTELAQQCIALHVALVRSGLRE